MAVVALDHLTKFAVVRTLAEGESRPVIDDVLRLSHIRNSGAAFGSLRGFGGVLVLAALVGVIAFAAIVVRNPEPLTAIAAGFVAGGAAGNLIDRIFRPGGVVDFVDFRFWPAFNVADSAITVGAILLLLTGLRTRSKEPDDGEPVRPGA
jgi:signal peptidase II